MTRNIALSDTSYFARFLRKGVGAPLQPHRLQCVADNRSIIELPGPRTDGIMIRGSSLALVFIFPLLFVVHRTALGEPEGITELKIGDSAPDFQLPGVDDKQYALQDFAGSKLLLVIFTCNHCPTAQAYESRIMELHADYKDRGVALVAISPNDDQALRLDELGYTDVGDSLEDMKQRAKDREFEFPYLYDGQSQKTSLAYGVVATPQVFLFDSERKLRYVGRIDNSDVKTVTSHDARNAIEALLAGKKVPVENTRTFGCSTKWSEKRADAKASIDKWNQEPVTLQSLDEAGLARLVKNDTENLLLVNVWATWCGPCVIELPDFVAMNRMYRRRKFQMATISMDEPGQKDAALETLKEHYVSATNYLSEIADRDRFADLLDKEWKGPVPYTLLIAPGGKVIYRGDGSVKPLEVRRAIVEYLGRTYADRDQQ
jgi:peroxiredoxin